MTRKTIFLIVACSGWSWASNGLIQINDTDNTSINFASVTLTNVHAGNTIVVGCSISGTGIKISTDSAGDTFHYAGSTITAQARNINMLYATNVAGGTTMVYCNSVGGNTTISIVAVEYGSTATAGGFDVTSSSANAAGANANFTTTNATTGQANETMTSFCGYLPIASVTSVNGTQEFFGGNNNTYFWQDATVASPSAYASTGVANATITNGFGCMQAAFKPSGAVVAPVAQSILGSGIIGGGM